MAGLSKQYRPAQYHFVTSRKSFQSLAVANVEGEFKWKNTGTCNSKNTTITWQFLLLLLYMKREKIRHRYQGFFRRFLCIPAITNCLRWQKIFLSIAFYSPPWIIIIPAESQLTQKLFSPPHWKTYLTSDVSTSLPLNWKYVNRMYLIIDMWIFCVLEFHYKLSIIWKYSVVLFNESLLKKQLCRV